MVKKQTLCTQKLSDLFSLKVAQFFKGIKILE